MKKALLAFGLFAYAGIYPIGSVAEGICDARDLIFALEALYDSDQQARSGLGLNNDVGNQEQLQRGGCGWRTIDIVGPKAALGAL